MALNHLLSNEAILASLRPPHKKALLQDLSARAGEVSGLPFRAVFDAVLQREKLGSTGVGRGIAIPHGKLAGCTKIFGVFARLERAVAFDAVDGEPVDLAFLLVAPESAGADHLKALASIARLLRDPAVTAELRFARDPATILSILSGDPAASHAA